MAQDSVTEYKIGPAIVRMHGQPDREKVKAATEKFLNRVERIRREQARKEGKAWQSSR
jgi:chaperonin cofactor prefoldin